MVAKKSGKKSGKKAGKSSSGKSAKSSGKKKSAAKKYGAKKSAAAGKKGGGGKKSAAKKGGGGKKAGGKKGGEEWRQTRAVFGGKKLKAICGHVISAAVAGAVKARLEVVPAVEEASGVTEADKASGSGARRGPVVSEQLRARGSRRRPHAPSFLAEARVLVLAGAQRYLATGAGGGVSS